MTWLGVGLCFGVAAFMFVMYAIIVVGSRADDWIERTAQEMDSDNG